MFCTRKNEAFRSLIHNIENYGIFFYHVFKYFKYFNFSKTFAKQNEKILYDAAYIFLCISSNYLYSPNDDKKDFF